MAVTYQPNINLQAQAAPTAAIPENPLVSVIVPVYNAERFIARTIASALNQTYKNIEIIAVVDGATDNSLAILQRCSDPRLKVVTQENQGVSVARNRGVEESQGEFLAFLDSDDIWFPHKIETELATLRRHGDSYAIIYSRYYGCDDDMNLVKLSPTYKDAGNIFRSVLLKEGLIIPSTAFLHRHIFDTVGGFPEHFKRREDWYFFLYAARQFQAYPTQQRLVIYKQSLTGKGRGKIKNYEEAIASNLVDNPDLQQMITPEEYELFKLRQKRSTFFSFLMYNYLDSAKRLYPKLTAREILVGNKGVLAFLAMKTNINFLYLFRLCYQFFFGFVLKPYWNFKFGWLRHLEASH